MVTRARLYHVTALAQVAPGDSVAIFGAGAIGLLAAYADLISSMTILYFTFMDFMAHYGTNLAVSP